MSFKLDKETNLTIKRGQKETANFLMADSQMYQKGNGVRAKLDSTTDVETFITALEPFIDGIITRYSGPMGRVVDDAKVRTADSTLNDAGARVFTVVATESGGGIHKCNIYIPNILNNKVSDAAGVIKALDYEKIKSDDTVVALTVTGVEVKTVV